MCAGSFDATVRLWDTRAGGGKAMMTLGEARDSISCVSVAGAEIWAGSVDGRVRVYDIRTGSMSVDVIGSTYPRPHAAKIRWMAGTDGGGQIR
jgi:mitogen-activated protein kinase organizer 1